MIAALALPTLVLFALAVAVARGVEALVPETPAGLALQAALSAVALTLLSAAAFAGLYAAGDAPLSTLLGADPRGGVMHFLGLGLKSALIWAPPMLLVVVTAPRRWRHGRW
ncbi:hypothetical protein SAMN05444340_10953 [Citreimonas salinaria]|uniref:Uncharacterized protein n=2 Tax=Citreimonas salinaria TaxID=321339 RepID=A0A1H3KCB6_9RHOB|nr:hypothetical protein SAMN05444340_10953 [Citreimonas salinaria]